MRAELQHKSRIAQAMEFAFEYFDVLRIVGIKRRRQLNAAIIQYIVSVDTITDSARAGAKGV